MSPPSIPGIQSHPDILTQYRESYAKAAGDRVCPTCACRKVVEKFRRKMDAIRRRDKRP